MPQAVSKPRVLLEGFGMGESPRWHDGRLWFSSWGTDEIIAVDEDGRSETMGRGAGGAGWAVNWLPDGRMLVTGDELRRVETDGSRVRHADLRRLDSRSNPRHRVVSCRRFRDDRRTANLVRPGIKAERSVRLRNHCQAATIAGS